MLKKYSNSVCQNDPLNGLTFYLSCRKILESIGEITPKEKEIGSHWCERAADALNKKIGSTPEEFENLGRLCEDLEAYVDAGDCYFEALKIKENLQKKPTPDDYKKLGKYMLEHDDNWSASYVYLSAFKAILSLGQIPSPEDCKNVVDLATYSESANYGEEAIPLFQQRINYIENLGQTPTSEDYLGLSRIHMDTSDLLYFECYRNNGQYKSEDFLNKASNHVILALKAMALSNQRPELKDYLGSLYPYPLDKICWFTASTQNIVEAEHHYRNLNLSGLEIPEEVKNWGENLDNYYNSAKLYNQQRFEELLKK
jgi:hypothetical protein